MAQITITVPDQYIPGAVAKMYDMNRTRETPYADVNEFFTDYATSLCSGACVDYKVGPNWVQPEPQWNADGTPYTPPAGDDTLAGGNDTTAGGGAGE